jgi:hypothetical protein
MGDNEVVDPFSGPFRSERMEKQKKQNYGQIWKYEQKETKTRIRLRCML